MRDHEVKSHEDADRTCFVICPLGEPGSPSRIHADKIREFVIAPPAARLGFTVVRSDEISESGVITNQIIRHLLDDRVVVAVLTDHNPNVFYELALRHAAGKPFAHLIAKGQKLPFDVAHARAIEYDFDDPSSVKDAKSRLDATMQSSLRDDLVESPVTVAAELRKFFQTSSERSDVVTQIVRQYDEISTTVSDIKNALLSPGLLKDAIPSFVREQMETMLRRYSNEIDLLKAVRDAGIIGVSRRRSTVIDQLKTAIDEEQHDILIVGSSLKGLLQNSEYKEVRDKLEFKSKIQRFQVRFLLTHPVFADFRARQEQRERGHIAREIISSLAVLKSWDLDPKFVRLYLGTPTAFAIKTSRKMFINPYPYRAQAYESPCLIVRSERDADADHAYYFYNHFNDAHFSAWDTNLAVRVESLDQAIREFETQMESYSLAVEEIIGRIGKRNN